MVQDWHLRVKERVEREDARFLTALLEWHTAVRSEAIINGVTMVHPLRTLINGAMEGKTEK